MAIAALEDQPAHDGVDQRQHGDESLDVELHDRLLLIAAVRQNFQV